MSFVKNSLSVLGTRISTIFLSLISSIIVTRILGPFNKGALGILVIIPYLLVNFGSLGIGNANLYFVGKKKYPIEKIVSNSLSLTLILGTILILIAYLIALFYKQTIFRGIPFTYTHLVFILIPFLLFQKFTQYTFLGKERITTRNIIILLPAIFNFIAIICFVVILRLNLLGVLIASLLSNIFAFILCFHFTSKISKIKLNFDYKLFIESVKFGIIPFLALVVMNLNFRADIFLIKYYLDNTAVGLYSLAASISEEIWLIPQSVGLVLFSRISNIEEREANALTPLTCRLSLSISFLCGLFLFLTANILIPFVYGEAFRPSVKPLLILLPGTVLMTIFLILHSDLTGRGKAIITLKIFTIAFFANIIMNIFLIPTYGINGAALASSASYSLGALVLAITFSKENSISLKDILLPKKFDFTTYIFPLVLKIKTKIVYNTPKLL